MWHISGVVHGFLRPNLMGTLQIQVAIDSLSLSLQTSRNPAEDRVVGELAYTGPVSFLAARLPLGLHSQRGCIGRQTCRLQLQPIRQQGLDDGSGSEIPTAGS